MIPEFDDRGLLPPGDYPVTFQQLRDSVLVRGTGAHPLDGPWRKHLADQAEVLVNQLWAVRITELYPHYPGLVAMHDRHGNALQFPAAFRLRRATDEPEGIVKLVPDQR